MPIVLKAKKTQMLSLKTKSGKPLFTEKDINSMVKGLENLSKRKKQKALGHEKICKTIIIGTWLFKNKRY